MNAHTEDALHQAAEIVKSGGTIVYPTDTLYGIGADALSPDAVRKVSLAKQRVDPKPILLLIPHEGALKALAHDVPPAAKELIKQFWPGPLTIVFKALDHLPTELTQGTGTVGVRLPANSLCITLMDFCGCPLTSSSANITGQPAHALIADIHRQLGDAIDLYLDAGELPSSAPSTVIDVSRGPATIVREGAITRKQIQEFISLL